MTLCFIRLRCGIIDAVVFYKDQIKRLDNRLSEFLHTVVSLIYSVTLKLFSSFSEVKRKAIAGRPCKISHTLWIQRLGVVTR